MSRYDELFFDYVNQSAIASATQLLPVVYAQLNPRSVLDVGCGEGGWLQIWKELGAEEVFGLDGAYVNPERLLIDRNCFRAEDLSRPFSLGRRFDLVQSLEVAEHLPESAADGFIASLVAHSDRVLFSAAIVGQGGDHHINEQPLSYWREKFAQQGYVPVDAVRPDVQQYKDIDPWYRYNTVLYVHRERVGELSSLLRERVLAPGQPLPAFTPPLALLRNRLIALLPTSLATGLAKQKEKFILKRLIRRQQRATGDV